jgi:hypothetical protein
LGRHRLSFDRNYPSLLVIQDNLGGCESREKEKGRLTALSISL